VDQPLPWLRYLDAAELEDDAIDFDGMNVQSPSGEHLGTVDGFIVDSDSARPFYVVVDSGGWFKSKHFLLPVGHAKLNPGDEAVVADLGRERVDRFPGFDRDEFGRLTDSDLKQLNDQICAACSIEGVAIVYATDEPYTEAWNRPDYAYPDWWSANPINPERMGRRAVTSGVETQSVASDAGQAARAHQDKDAPTRETGEESPHFDGRAQPGDVLGVETGGERTYIGDTSEDENERRRRAEVGDRQQREQGKS
jgi:hypothetical protein